jgi:hypothetical protein
LTYNGHNICLADPTPSPTPSPTTPSPTLSPSAWVTTSGTFFSYDKINVESAQTEWTVDDAKQTCVGLGYECVAFIHCTDAAAAGNSVTFISNKKSEAAPTYACNWYDRELMQYNFVHPTMAFDFVAPLDPPNGYATKTTASVLEAQRECTATGGCVAIYRDRISGLTYFPTQKKKAQIGPTV